MYVPTRYGPPNIDMFHKRQVGFFGRVILVRYGIARRPGIYIHVRRNNHDWINHIKRINIIGWYPPYVVSEK